jgi:hypothetical protein
LRRVEFNDIPGRALRLVLICALAAALVAPSAPESGEWHRGEKLACDKCHTMHNSRQGQPMRYDKDEAPAPHLLRHATSVSLCIYCHDGNTGDPTAPDVMAPHSAEYAAADPAGGFFAAPPGVASDTAHNLAPPTAIAPPDGDTPVDMTCVTCHEPHGNASYRNLRASPSGTGRGSGSPITVDQILLPGNGTAPQVYGSGNMKYRSGVSGWCMDCHNRYDATTSHPTDRTVSGATFADYGFWSGNRQNRVRVQNPLDPNTPSQDDQVFCLTCHKAHGSSKPDALIYADGVIIDSTCNQCHNM